MNLEEEFQQIAIADVLRIKHDLDRLGMRSMVAIGRVRHIAARGLLVSEFDGMGRRKVTLVESAWTTAPSDPGGDEVANESCGLKKVTPFRRDRPRRENCADRPETFADFGLNGGIKIRSPHRLIRPNWRHQRREQGGLRTPFRHRRSIESGAAFQQAGWRIWLAAGAFIRGKIGA